MDRRSKYPRALLGLCLLTGFVCLVQLVESKGGGGGGGAAVYIIYTSKPAANAKADALKKLTAVLGNAAAANKALIIVYNNISGFSAKITDAQATAMKNQPGVVLVKKSTVY